MAKTKRIPIPLGNRLKRARARFLPVLIFGGAVALTVTLWMRHSVMPNGWGTVEAVRYDVGSHVDGTLVWDATRGMRLFEAVKAGQVIARLDGRPIVAAIEVVKAERLQLEKQLAATKLEAVLDQNDRLYTAQIDRRRLLLDIERLQLELLDRDALIAADRIDQQRREEKIKLTEELVNKGSQAEFELFTEKMKRDIVNARIDGNLKSRAEVLVQLKTTQDRFKALEDAADPEFDLLLEPIRQGMAVQQARMDELQTQIDTLTIRAPIDGTIVAIYRRPGQAVVAGEPIITIADEIPQRIIAYIRPSQRIRPEPGMTVQVRARSNPTLIAQSSIDTIGPQVELIPQQHLANPTMPEWGLPISISLPAEFNLRPGELVDLTFQR